MRSYHLTTLAMRPLVSTVLLAEVVRLLDKKEYRAREQAFTWLYKYSRQPIMRTW